MTCRQKERTPFELVYSDICGTLLRSSPRGYRYFITFVDTYTQRVAVYPLRSRDESADALVRLCATMKVPRQNGIAERMNRTLNEMATAFLLHHQTTVALWSFAVDTAAFLTNRLPTASRSTNRRRCRWSWSVTMRGRRMLTS
mmetsp:Transcript_28399/g.70946  ORF Transcript_28399/g.70946 Transcript_28399/m.70946 type:complete len:143 (+) Transcript_28399:893-1321(+)